MSNITLKIPRATVTVRGLAEGDNASFARAQMLDNALDRAIFAGCIPTLQDDQYLVIAFDEVPLQLDQFDLELVEAVPVGLFRNRGCVLACVLFFDFLAHSDCLTNLKREKLIDTS